MWYSNVLHYCGFLELYLLDNCYSSGYFEVDNVTLANHTSSNYALVHYCVILLTFHGVQKVQTAFSASVFSD